MREDDAEAIIEAIALLKGVLRVDPLVSNNELHIAESRVRHELGRKLIKMIYPDFGENK